MKSLKNELFASNALNRNEFSVIKGGGCPSSSTTTDVRTGTTTDDGPVWDHDGIVDAAIQ